MSVKYFDVNGETKCNNTGPKPKARLENGMIIEYDTCCLAGTAHGFGPKVLAKFLGRGIIHEVNGVLQVYPTTNPPVYDFWKVFK